MIFAKQFNQLVIEFELNSLMKKKLRYVPAIKTPCKNTENKITILRSVDC